MFEMEDSLQEEVGSLEIQKHAVTTLSRPQTDPSQLGCDSVTRGVGFYTFGLKRSFDSV